MKRFFKNNAVLVLGISLPLLLVALLLLMHTLARLGQTPPQHAVVYAGHSHYAPQYWYQFKVDDGGRLRIEYRAPDDNNAYASRRSPAGLTIAVYDARSDSLDTYDIDLPDQTEPGETVRLDVPPALGRLRISDAATSPDGYRFQTGYGGHGGLFASIFGHSGRRSTRLIKDGVPYELPEIDSASGNLQLIGWVIDES